MGQRLVVTIHNNDKELAKIYYHWSAYSHCALYRAQEIVNCIYNSKDESEKDMLLRLIRFCEESGGGIRWDEKEIEYIKSLYPGETFREEGQHRSYGLIALSEDGMEDLQKWSEGDLHIYLDKDEIHNEVYGYYESIEEYNEERKEWDDEFEELTLDDVRDIGYDLAYINIEDLDYIIEELKNVDFICRNGDEIFELIE